MKYVIRSVKYLLKLVVLLAAIFALMKVTGTSNIDPEAGALDYVKAFFATTRGRMFTAVLLVWCALYPMVEFVRRTVNCDIKKRRDAIVRAFEAGGMRLASEEEGRMTFRAAAPARALWWLGEEAVTVTASGDGAIELEGPRRFVMEAQHRIPNYVNTEDE
jgi:hypothetical protein